ncbi:LacI family DNA-binding transcriptional regulator [Umezawaea sp. Da 62-37]|uniref:LacI family DNA-binding transcriptional regulator n=1 Tax=Umezawaea sp. Da 62-37 TaxID=3075927 RepID=UPI0028F6F53D|nr:LacI family DNA-binding transcriptional regulator [Umezawaea sp. Da 62-37]WNV86865.1 LacI family DNA-binding transcriptional regulator [Umezawaea sp. Da 62-37]
MSRQVTMSDIAKRVGVSRVAVSYALNGRPGVSAEVRDRVLAVAREVGFTANGSALALRGATSGAVGLTMRRPSSATIAVEVFRRELISGVQDELMARDMGLVLRFVEDTAEELDVYRRWSAERRVGGVLLCDLETHDPRVGALRGLGLPAVVVGGPAPDDGVTSVWCDDAAAVKESVRHLAGLGHRHVTRVSGPVAMAHTVVRDTAFRTACAALGIEATVVRADYSGAAGTRVTRRILSAPGRPTAIVYDNDVMAVAGLAVAQEMGVGVPSGLSIVAYEDSSLCQAVAPALTVLRRDLIGYGAHAARLLLDVLDGAPPRAVKDQTAALVVRGSTGPPG